MILTLCFALFVALDAAALGLVFLLGLAAATPSHTPVLQVVAFFLLPALLLAGLVWLFLRRPTRWLRGLLTGVVGLPVLLVLGSVGMSQLAAWQQGVPADGWGRPDMATQQQLLTAIANDDAATVARIAAQRQHTPINEGEALVAALRRLEQAPQALAVLEALLQAGVAPDAGGAEAPLAAAIRVSRVAGIVPMQRLLQAGADPNQRGAGSQPAWFAALSPSTDAAVLPALLAHGVSLGALDMAGHNAVYNAVSQQHWAAVLLLVEHGAPWQREQWADGQGLRQRVEAARRQAPGDATLTRLAQRLEQPTAAGAASASMR